MRSWLLSLPARPRIFVEPFGGGGIVGLTVAAERLADEVVIGELDSEVAAVWKTVLNGNSEWLIDRILDFKISRENVIRELAQKDRSVRCVAFRTVLRNRVQRGGILAPGASLVRKGENGRGVASRWYPVTLARRIRDIAELRNRLIFVEGDAFDLIARYTRRRTCAYFVDPPYTAAGKCAGRRLYRHNEVDHDRLFKVISRAAGTAMLTYDDTDHVEQLAEKFRFKVDRITMKNTHHMPLDELVITNGGE